jgi:CheY-like chemotaxis protein
MPMKDRFPILLVEDNPDDVFFVKRAFTQAGVENPIHVVSSGQEAIEYLQGDRDFSDRQKFPMPGLVLLDLKMPRVSGFDVIEWMRKDRRAKLIPVVILSSSALPDDVNRAYALGANAYMVKPPSIDALQRLFETIFKFWAAGEQPTFEGD